MKKAVPIFGAESHNWTPAPGCVIRAYRCSECLKRFEIEQTVVAPQEPRCCPMCGAIYQVSR